MSEEDTLIVPINGKSWELVKEENIYVRPASLGKSPDYIAFYRTAPISAITHVAEVVKHEVTDSSIIGAGKQLVILGDIGIDVDALHIKGLEEIENIETESRGIQKFWYTERDKFDEVSVLEDLQE